MPKRQRSFDYDLVPQMKVHLGQKEYDLKHESNMSKIHDKTLQILFKGTSQLYQTNVKSGAANLTDMDNKCIEKNVSEFCAICTNLNVAECVCSFCDKWMCQPCSAVCLKCYGVFCLAHSLKLYRSEDDGVCLNCYVEKNYVVNK